MRDLAALETDWTRRLDRGEAPDAAALRAHLLAVHARPTGFTESCARRCLDGEGRSSYALLADLVAPGERVLDLGCGSGPLLELIHTRHGTDVTLAGLDMSADELALARARLGDDTVALHQGLAQELPFADATFDTVLCHWALTLMDPVAPVLTEVARVLRPGGRFAAVVDGPMASAPGYEEIHDIVYTRVAAAHPRYGSVDLGDPRVRSAEALSALALECMGTGAHATTTAAVLTLEGPPDVLACEAAGFFYAFLVLSAEARAETLAALEAFFATPGPAQGRYAMPVTLLSVQKSGAA
ncbi:MAG: class I SAM-dependent methyltransferase [Pseudomonadota bacterium]